MSASKTPLESEAGWMRPISWLCKKLCRDGRPPFVRMLSCCLVVRQAGGPLWAVLSPPPALWNRPMRV
jgi:hypothetical protein